MPEPTPTLNTPAPEPTPIVNDPVPNAGADGAANTPVVTSILADGLTFKENWREYLPEEIRAEPSLENIKTVDSLAKSYVSGQKMIGLDKVAIPTDHSTPDVWNEFFNKSGRPEAATDYNFSDIKFSENIAPTSEEESAAKEAMHALGLSNKQAHGIYDYYKNHAEHQLEAFEQQQHKNLDDAVTELKAEYGYAYDAKLEKANRAMRTFDPNGVIEKLGIANDPDMVRMMVKIGESISEDKMIGNEPPSALTPNDAATKVNKLLANPAYYDKDHPEHGAMVNEVQRLMKYMHPELAAPSVSPSPGGGFI